MTMLHLRLSHSAIAAVKHRARQSGMAAAEYVELVMWYAHLELERLEPVQAEDTAADDQELYFSAPLTPALREHMVTCSAAQERNLAAFTGSLVERYLATFERDPGDLRMVSRLGELLHTGSLLNERELLTVLRLAAESPVSRMPGTYQARWLHQRFKPFLPQVEWEGEPTELTVAHITTLLERLK
jgi:hypothetical protein